MEKTRKQKYIVEEGNQKREGNGGEKTRAFLLTRNIVKSLAGPMI